MSVTVILEAQAKPGQKQVLLEELIKFLPETRRYKGFIDITIYGEVDSDILFFISEWKTVEDYKAYFQWRIDTGVIATLSQSLKVEPKILFLVKEISNDLEIINKKQ